MRKSDTGKDDKISKSDGLLIGRSIDKSNIFRLKFTLPAVMVLALVHIIIFAVKLDTAKQIEYVWRLGIITGHSFLFIVSALSLFMVLRFKEEQKKGTLFRLILPNALFLITLIISAILTAYDQLITTSITPFIIVSISLPIILSLPNLNAVLCYLTGFFLMVILMPQFQKNSEVILSNDVNALTAITIGLIISFTYRKLNSDKYRKELIINRQKEELHLQYEKLVVSSDELLHSNQIKDKFFSIIAHDLKSPFMGILGLTRILNENARQLSMEEISEYSALLSNSASSLYSLLDNLLEWSRMQRGLTPFNPQEHNVAILVQKSIEVAESSAKVKELKILNEADREIIAVFDFQMLYTVLRNLLSNAIKFSQRGGHIIVNAQSDGNAVSISVRDFGIGITEETLNDLFQIDKKVSTPGTEGESSTGLGLLLCKEYIDRHCGQIWAESVINQGTTFFVRIPLILG